MNKKMKKKNKQNIDQKIEELYSLKTKIKKELYKKEMHNFKELNIRNLKIFKETCKCVLPYITSALICTGAFKISGNGLPFIKDEIPHYSEYYIDYETGGNFLGGKLYSRKSDLLSNNYLNIYTPWEKENGKFVRYCREYDATELTNKEAYQAIVDGNYEYIKENIHMKKETKEVADELLDNEFVDIFWDVNIRFYDKLDFILMEENDKHANMVSIITLGVSLLSGFLINIFKDVKYIETCRKINDNYYNYRLIAIKPVKEQLDKTSEDIKKLVKKKEDMKNAK